MAALTKISGRVIKIIEHIIPDPPPVIPTPPPVIPRPPSPPPRDPWNYYGGFYMGSIFVPGNKIIRMTISVFVYGYTSEFHAYFSNGTQLEAWINGALVKLYPDYHSMARTVIPEWDYFNW